MDPRIERLQRASANERGLLCLAGGLPAEELFPRRALAEAFERAVRTSPCGALQYGWPEGNEALRAWIAARLVARGADVSAEDVVVTAGAQQALAIAAELIDVAGARVGVDDETYPGALELFRARGAATVASEDAACHYVVAGASNPRGLGVARERRAQLLASQRAIVVDEAYAELRFDGRLEPLFLAEARDRVFHVGTFSKTLCPGFRVGWLVVPRAFRDAARDAKRDLDLQAGSLAQAIVERWLARNDFDAHLARARALYSARAERLARALRRELPDARVEEPEGGFAVFVETDREGIDEADALAVATRRGVSFDPGSMFRADGARSPLAMRLSGSSVPEDRIEEAVRRLAQALAEVA